MSDSLSWSMWWDQMHDTSDSAQDYSGDRGYLSRKDRLLERRDRERKEKDYRRDELEDVRKQVPGYYDRSY